MTSAFELAQALIEKPVERYDRITYALIRSSISKTLDGAKLWYSAADILRDWSKKPLEVPDDSGKAL